MALHGREGPLLRHRLRHSAPRAGAALAATALTLALALAAGPGGAIVRRHDRPEALYRAAAGRLRCVVQVGGQGAGTLIARQWVLTSGHVVQAAGPFERGARLDSVAVPYDRVRVDPSADLALVHLVRPLAGARTARLYERHDEAGRVLTVAGPGAGGDGLIGTNPRDDRMRAGRNRVAQVDGARLVMDFDPPPAGEELEGVPGPGDAGGPALLERDGDEWLVGVASASRSELGVAPHLYGSREDYVRVSACLDWIRGAMADGPDADLGFGPTHALARAGWPASGLGALARDWIATRNRGDAAAMDSFLVRDGDPAYWGRLAAGQRRAAFAASWDALGPFEPAAWAEGPGGSLAVLARAGDGRWLDCRFWPAAGPDQVRLGRIVWTPLDGPPVFE